MPEESGINRENGEAASVTRALEGAAAAWEMSLVPIISCS